MGFSFRCWVLAAECLGNGLRDQRRTKRVRSPRLGCLVDDSRPESCNLVDVERYCPAASGCKASAPLFFVWQTKRTPFGGPPLSHNRNRQVTLAQLPNQRGSTILRHPVRIWVWLKISPADFGPWFHLPGFHFGYRFLTHSHMLVPLFVRRGHWDLYVGSFVWFGTSTRAICFGSLRRNNLVFHCLSIADERRGGTEVVL